MTKTNEDNNMVNPIVQSTPKYETKLLWLIGPDAVCDKN